LKKLNHATRLQYHPQGGNFPHKSFTNAANVDKLLMFCARTNYTTSLRLAKYAEKDVSTEETQVQQGSRISETHADQGRTDGPEASQAEGPEARLRQAHGLQVRGEALKSTHLLPSANRLLKERDFFLLSRSRTSAFAKALGMKVRENALPHSRFGIVVGLKVSKRATERNLIKRRIREIIRKSLKNVKAGYDLMVMANPMALKTEPKELERQALDCLRKLHLLA
jgi:ribonuclease P protein component